MVPHTGVAATETHRLVRDSSIPIWHEFGAWMEWIELRRSPVYRGAGVPHGRGEYVILVPGTGQFLAERALDELFLTLAPQIAGRDEHSQRPGLVSGHLFAPDDVAGRN